MREQMPYIILLGALICITNLAMAQEQPNPFKSIGKRGDVIDISKGKYVEIVLKDSLERIGSVTVNRYTRKIDKFLDDDSITQNPLNSSIQSRFLSVDPLTKAYAELSPYQYAENTPIQAIDLDGLEKYVVTNWYNDEGVLRKVSIKSIRDKDVKEVVDLNFKSANGADLTNKDVYVRNLYMNGKQKASPIERNDLSKDERKLYDAARSYGSNDPDVDKIFYDFTDQRNGAGIVSNKFDGQIFEYREAEKRIPVIKDLHQSFSGGVFAFTGIADIVGSGVKNGTLTLDYPGGEKILKLLKDIKEDGGIKTAEITLTSSVSGASLEEFAAYKRGLDYAGKQYQALFNKAGVKNVRINVNALRDQPGGSGGIDIKLKR